MYMYNIYIYIYTDKGGIFPTSFGVLPVSREFMKL